jgi:hypothetical protein
MRRVNSQVDRQVGNAFVGARHPFRLILDLLHYLKEIHKLSALAVEELSIRVGRVDELENQGSSSDDTVSSRQKVSENGSILM